MAHETGDWGLESALFGHGGGGGASGSGLWEEAGYEWHDEGGGGGGGGAGEGGTMPTWEDVDHDGWPGQGGDGGAGGASVMVGVSAPITTPAATSSHATLPVDAVLPSHLRRVMPYTHLNAMQSVVFDAAYHGTGNLAVSAPTSAGKTAIFDLAILSLLARSATTVEPGGCRIVPYGKVVYLCPTRALASERQRDWTARFGPLGLRIVCFTGDDGGDAAGRIRMDEVGAADIIITTPEKWDATTRRWRDNASLIGQVALVCIDEVHLLNEERGAVMEAIVSRMRTVSASPLIISRAWPAAHLRLVAVSATIPNLADVGQWVGAAPEHTFSFDDTYRPVPLTTHVLGYDTKGGGGGGGTGGFMLERFLSQKVMGVVARYGDGRPALVFCASRNGVKTTAEQIVRDAGGGGLSRTPTAKAACADVAATVSDARLRECLLRGVGFHSAGETPGDRAAVESLFLAGHLPILCTTTTLAVGVNLPAHLVVIKSTQAWRGSSDGYTEYPRSTILQMMGRAGRPQFDTRGVAVIMTQSSTRQRYTNLAAGSEPVESNLLPSLPEHLASEICLHTVSSVATALAWMRSTFLYRRMSTHPSHYHLPPATTASTAALDDHVRTVVMTHLLRLADLRCIDMLVLPAGGSGSKDGDPCAGDGVPCNAVGFTLTTVADMRLQTDIWLRPTPLAFVLTRHYLRIDTFAMFTRAPPDATLVTLMRHVVNVKEVVGSMVVRRDEKRVLREVKERLGRVKSRKGVEGTVATVGDKAFQLVQLALGRLKLDKKDGALAYHLKMEAGQMVVVLKRVCRALAEYCTTDTIRSPLAPMAALAHRSFEHQLWPDCGFDKHLLQAPGLTEAMLPGLRAIGVESVEQLGAPRVTAAMIDAAVKKSHPFGQTVKRWVDGFTPRLTITLTQRDEAAAAAGVATLIVTVKPASPTPVTLLAVGGKDRRGGTPLTQARLDGYMQRPQQAGEGGGESGDGASHGATSKQHVYTLYVVADGVTIQPGLLLTRPGIRVPMTLTIQVRDPRALPGPPHAAPTTAAAPVHAYLIHDTVHGLDQHASVQPLWGMHPVPKRARLEPARAHAAAAPATAAVSATAGQSTAAPAMVPPAPADSHVVSSSAPAPDTPDADCNPPATPTLPSSPVPSQTATDPHGDAWFVPDDAFDLDGVPIHTPQQPRPGNVGPSTHPASSHNPSLHAGGVDDSWLLRDLDALLGGDEGAGGWDRGGRNGSPPHAPCSPTTTAQPPPSQRSGALATVGGGVPGPHPRMPIILLRRPTPSTSTMAPASALIQPAPSLLASVEPYVSGIKRCRATLGADTAEVAGRAEAQPPPAMGVTTTPPSPTTKLGQWTRQAGAAGTSHNHLVSSMDVTALTDATAPDVGGGGVVMTDASAMRPSTPPSLLPSRAPSTPATPRISSPPLHDGGSASRGGGVLKPLPGGAGAPPAQHSLDWQHLSRPLRTGATAASSTSLVPPARTPEATTVHVGQDAAAHPPAPTPAPPGAPPVSVGPDVDALLRDWARSSNKRVGRGDTMWVSGGIARPTAAALATSTPAHHPAPPPARTSATHDAATHLSTGPRLSRLRTAGASKMALPCRPAPVPTTAATTVVPPGRTPNPTPGGGLTQLPQPITAAGADAVVSALAHPALQLTPPPPTTTVKGDDEEPGTALPTPARRLNFDAAGGGPDGGGRGGGAGAWGMPCAPSQVWSGGGADGPGVAPSWLPPPGWYAPPMWARHEDGVKNGNLPTPVTMQGGAPSTGALPPPPIVMMPWWPAPATGGAPVPWPGAPLMHGGGMWWPAPSQSRPQ